MRESNRRFGNKNAEKERRRIELGWIHKCGSKSVQIRSKKGGGTRKLTQSKDVTKKDLLDMGKMLFFPNGQSSKISNLMFGITKIGVWMKTQQLAKCIKTQTCPSFDFI